MPIKNTDLVKLRELAEKAIDAENVAFEVSEIRNTSRAFYIKQTKREFQDAANPETIIALLEELREQSKRRAPNTVTVELMAVAEIERLTAIVERTRNDALEEAAKITEEKQASFYPDPWVYGYNGISQIAKAIRAIKTATPTI